MSILGLILTYLLNKAEKPTYTNNYDKKRVNQESNEGRLLTDEVDDEASVAGTASRFAEERPPVRRRAVGAVAAGRQVDVVARVCQRVAEAEDAGVARLVASVATVVVGAAVCPGAGGYEKR